MLIGLKPFPVPVLHGLRTIFQQLKQQAGTQCRFCFSRTAVYPYFRNAAALCPLPLKPAPALVAASKIKSSPGRQLNIPVIYKESLVIAQTGEIS